MTLRYTAQHDAPLLQYLYELFPERSRTAVKALLAKGQVQVRGTAVTAFDHPLRRGDRIEVLPKALTIARSIRNDARTDVGRTGIRILHEDAHLLVVDKPAGMATVSTGRVPHEKTLYSILDTYVKSSARAARKEALETGSPIDRSAVKVWIVHRLDRGTSGLLIIAKDRRTQELLQSQWKQLVLERRYTAFLEGVPDPPEGTVRSYLTDHPKSLKVHSSPVETADSQLAVTRYRVVGTVRLHQPYARVECSLETGRKNQIRVHAAELDHPVAGDAKYGARTNPIGRLALHAGRLVFRHPHTREVLQFQSDLPTAFDRFLNGK